MNYEFSIFYFIDLFKKHWRILLAVVIIPMILTTGISLMKPVTYVSSATLFLKDAAAVSAGYSISKSPMGKFLGLADVVSSSKIVIINIFESRRMATDIREEFSSKHPDLWWEIRPYEGTWGISLEVRGPDPALTEKIANFCIRNLDKINTELELSVQSPMVKVLDAPTYGTPEKKRTLTKIVASGMFSFLA
ncbi:MAG: hypothetical protein HQ547_02290, partial [Candidatus Omnitrophica bacterium]|nr:hypothetical protein [Candidatus Omnitrophota bacterium]